jgi:hypothetical protein
MSWMAWNDRAPLNLFIADDGDTWKGRVVLVRCDDDHDRLDGLADNPRRALEQALAAEPQLRLGQAHP